MSNFGYIYVIENIKNNKVYVGKTLQKVEDRFSQHIKKLFVTMIIPNYITL
jgi:hypothetical protein